MFLQPLYSDISLQKDVIFLFCPNIYLFSILYPKYSCIPMFKIKGLQDLSESVMVKGGGGGLNRFSHRFLEIVDHTRSKMHEICMSGRSL